MNRNMERNIFDYLPRDYEELRESYEMLTSEQAEFERLNANINDVLAQMFVDTATWGLAEWERIVGVESFPNKPIGERRSVIKAKLRGAGVVTVAHIKGIAESWYGGDTEVREETADYLIVVKFVSSYGVPMNLDDVETALREIIPAHLDVEFEFMYVTYDMARMHYGDYDELISQGRTYEEVLNGGF